MFGILSVAFLLTTVRSSKCEELTIFDNSEHGVMEFGSEQKMVDYALLAADKKIDLPPSFTICSSVHLNFMTSSVFFYQLYQDDGMPWFNLMMRSTRDLDKFQEKVKLLYYTELSNIKTTLDPVPIEPNSWYHGCTALDTVTGYMLVVVNGHIIIDQVITELINTNENPKSLDGKLSLFKNFYSGFWYQSRQRLTNLNVYATALTIDKMIDLTDRENCSDEGDYLSWTESQWNVTGNIDQESVVKEEDICYRSTSTIVLFTDIFLEWEECMFFCEKLPNTRAPSVATKKKFLDMIRAVDRIIFDPVTGNMYPGSIGSAYWIPITDRKIEGQWVDFYTSDPVNILGVAAGEPNGGRAENCGMVVSSWGGWQDFECKVNKNSHMQCPCESDSEMFLAMRGLSQSQLLKCWLKPKRKGEPQP